MWNRNAWLIFLGCRNRILNIWPWIKIDNNVDGVKKIIGWEVLVYTQPWLWYYELDSHLLKEKKKKIPTLRERHILHKLTKNNKSNLFTAQGFFIRQFFDGLISKFDIFILTQRPGKKPLRHAGCTLDDDRDGIRSSQVDYFHFIAYRCYC